VSNLSSGPVLVVLAAGMGSRFGGMKQLASVGPRGETLMDYSVFDAMRAGFGSVVFVIRPDMDEAFRALAGGRYGDAMPVALVHQRLDDLPPGCSASGGRSKPWGTGQAVLATESVVDGPFVVINADDFYGRAAYAALAAFVGGPATEATATFGLAGFRLRDTLSESGSVNRGIIDVSRDGTLEAIDEVFDIQAEDDGRLTGRGGDGVRLLDGDTLVSMNMWGFTHSVFQILRDGFRRFLEHDGGTIGEYLLPTAMQSAVRHGHATVRVLDPGGTWFGITHPDDAASVSASLGKLLREGVYPDPLFA
jgi:hypothetical protein